jgi:hypothetical protein
MAIQASFGSLELVAHIESCIPRSLVVCTAFAERLIASLVMKPSSCYTITSHKHTIAMLIHFIAEHTIPKGDKIGSNLFLDLPPFFGSAVNVDTQQPAFRQSPRRLSISVSNTLPSFPFAEGILFQNTKN